ncbi:DUF2268 domain-containing putative Zn-dependent protease [Chimaeribacter arupi]|uniref:DUF2268 domain-containing putative Zn-dependent protease n=1 Tax=Chimaeribacter arupi TaxID=2060066 RepID=UPI001F4ECCC4|nr:DUF2268 domain-containing putative Zn-dependent protease [Chimaeribacter arupi]
MLMLLGNSIMPQMTLHILNAHGKLTPYCEWLHSCLPHTYALANKVMPLPAVDVVVKAGAYVIPEKGHMGYCPEPGVVYITVDPENPAFSHNEEDALERMFAHELHHAARWAGPGYGRTLGEALVSEGLAGHFALELFAGEPEPWERLSSDILQPYIPHLSEYWHRTDYDHNAWFYGTGSLPRWLGYSAGFHLVSRYLAAAPHLRASMLANAEAEAFRAFV